MEQVLLQGLSAPHDGIASISSNSDNSDYDPISKLLSSHYNFTALGCFMSKPVHPLAFPVQTKAPKFHDLNDFKFSDVSEPMECGSFNRSNGKKCSMCEWFLNTKIVLEFPKWRYTNHRGSFMSSCLSCRNGDILVTVPSNE